MDKKTYEFISKQTNDPIVEWKTCKVSGQEFPIYQSDLEFYDKISPTFNGVKYQIPTPTLCPEERQRRRLAFRNERKLYRRTCDASGQNIISMYSPDKSCKIYHKDYRWSDARDATFYGGEYDVTLSFNEQFKSLYDNVPKFSLNLTNNENVEYGNDVEQAKNCYMIFNSWDVEDSYYTSATGPQCGDIVDAYRVNYSDIIYEGVYLIRCHHVFYSSYCNDCSFCEYCVDCQSCQYCYDCCGIKNKQYCIGNVQYTPEEYHTELQSYQRDEAKNTIKVIRNVRSENVIGNNMIDSGDCVMCYGMVGCHNCKYSTDGINFDMAYDTTNCGTESTYVYESIGTYFVSYSGCTIACNSITRSRYCVDCFSCADCFGCVGLHHKKYCIFNKQYTKEAYEKKVASIVNNMQKNGERGEFFPASLSIFGYNETVAAEYMPLDENAAKQKGYNWLNINYDPIIPSGVEVIQKRMFDEEGRKNLLYDDKISKAIFICEISGRPFRLITQEIAFYKKYNLPLPSLHPDIRHMQRIQKRHTKIEDQYL